MLKEVDQNIVDNNMDSDPNLPPTPANPDHLALHKTNVYQPPEFSVTTMAASPNRVFLAARRACLSNDFQDKPFSKLDLYDITSKEYPRFVLSIIEYEDITGLAWLDEKHFIGVSKQATINVYSAKLGVKTKVFTTDYGSITSMKYSQQENFLVTGTEYGYAVGYRILDTGSLIECDKKMVKINGPIRDIDFYLKPRDVPMEISSTTKKEKPKTNPPSRKRKRADSSEESDGGDSDQEDETATDNGFLADNDVTIYGACDKKVVIWDYHKTRIVDSIVIDHSVCCVLALKNGDFVFGDSDGCLSVYDNTSLTCRQNTRILKSHVSCLARDSRNSAVLAAGREPIITLLKTESTIKSQDEYILFEQIKDHSAKVNYALFTSKKEFFTCSDDDLIIKFRLSKSDGKRKLKRYIVRPSHKSRIQMNTGEIMTISGSRLNIYEIPAQFRSDIETYPTRMDLPAPKRICVIKAYAYICAAAFDERFICYSTRSGVKIIDRPGLAKLGTPSLDLPNCHILKLCQSRRFLVSGQQTKIFITALDENRDSHETNGNQGDGEIIFSKRGNVQEKIIEEKTRVYETVYVSKFKGMVREVLYQEASEQLIVSCGTTRHFLYILQLPQTSTCKETKTNNKIDIIHKLSLPSSPLSHLTLNFWDDQDPYLYMYTTNNQLIKCDIRAKSLKAELAKMIEEQVHVTNITKDKNVIGIVILSRRNCLVYDSKCIMKLSIDNNEIVNETAQYDDINAVSNMAFKQPEELLII